MKRPKIRTDKKPTRAVRAREHKKHIDRWWLKYEAASDLDAEFPTPPDLVLSMLNSVHEHWRNRGDISVNMREDLRHHIAMQKVFKKWREIHGERI